MKKTWLTITTVSFGIGLGLSLIVNRDFKKATLNGLLSIPATTVGVLISEHQIKKRLNKNISIKQEQLRELTRQKVELQNSISLLLDREENLKQQEENLQVAISELQENKQRAQSQLDALQIEIQEFRIINPISNQKSLKLRLDYNSLKNKK